MSSALNPRRLLLCCMLGTTLLGTAIVAKAATAPTIIYLSRHAEKVIGPDDPDLTPQGQARARQIAATLRSAGIAHVFSTKAKRAMQTAQPLAGQLGLTVQTYDAAQAAKFVQEIKKLPGAMLVIGHSNTVPPLVQLLGGEPGPEIDEQTEFDRLYQLIIAPDGSVTTVRLNSVVP